MSVEKYDFGGYATKHDLQCSDGRVIRPGAFKDQDGAVVPLVWRHTRDTPDNVLGHAYLEYRPDGVYAYCTFNSNETAQVAKELVKHGDITSLSIYANRLKQKASDVVHGIIREVSLVLSGANPGAVIDNLAFEHSDGEIEFLETDAIISFDLDIEQNVQLIHEDEKDKKEQDMDDETKTDESTESGEKTVEEVLDELTPEQYDVTMALIGMALEEARKEVAEGSEDEEIQQEDDEYEEIIEHSDQKEGQTMKKNVFDQNGSDSTDELKHIDTDVFFADAKRMGSMREAALEHGITDVQNWFPEAKTVGDTPANIARPMEWVAGVIGGVRRTPFSRVKSLAANLTADEARARGYIKGSKKVEEQVVALKRVTTPTTVYKLQKLDRDDVLDITDFDVVVWIKAEMRMMLDEEIARAILISDGRGVSATDKINEVNIRPIWTDDEVYAIHKTFKVADPAAVTDPEAMKLVDEIVRMRKNYKGSGNPTLFIGTDLLCTLRLLRDGEMHRMYKTDAELASDLRVSRIEECNLFDNLERDVEGVKHYMGAIITNLRDYTVGADRGGEINFFEDFDIDYNKQAYLIETRISGALTQPASALVMELIK